MSPPSRCRIAPCRPGAAQRRQASPGGSPEQDLIGLGLWLAHGPTHPFRPRCGTPWSGRPSADHGPRGRQCPPGGGSVQLSPAAPSTSASISTRLEEGGGQPMPLSEMTTVFPWPTPPPDRRLTPYLTPFPVNFGALGRTGQPTGGPLPNTKRPSVDARVHRAVKSALPDTTSKSAHFVSAFGNQVARGRQWLMRPPNLNCSVAL